MTGHKQSLRELLESKALYPRNTIIAKKRLAPKIYEMEVYAPLAIHNALPGQFVNDIVHDHGKSVPLTIADYDEKTGILTQVFQTMGVSTMKMATLDVGDTLYSIRGPLGVASEIKKYDGAIICVAGGVGVAPMYPVVRALKEAGNTIILILGAREEKFLFWEEKIRPYTDKTIVCIEEGEMKEDRVRGRITPTLTQLIDWLGEAKQLSHVFGVGPIPMLQAIAAETKPRGVKFIASAVAMMVDGTGMCFGCQYNKGGKTFRLCIDGPEVDGNDIDWKTLNLRLNQFRSQEAVAMEEFKKTDLYQKYLAQEEVPL
ncbi:MAG: sulfide/dihydroorotate dehydrogenase-like FAD/NAD-binding protein [Candidatus Paceibacterota bacterium]|jgi:ferredoxin--NADP+ reductase